MSLTDLKPKHQREALKKIALGLLIIEENFDDDSIELVLGALEDDVFDSLESEYGDFFGTEGWKQYFNIEE